MKIELLAWAAFCSLLTISHPASGQIWTQTGAPTAGWGSVACSADGTRLVAAGLYTGAHVSTNSGANWSSSGGPGKVISSTNGLALYNTYPGTSIIQSSSDGGDSWQFLATPEVNFQAIACSSDGSKLVAAASTDLDGNPGAIFRSVNFGADWTLLNADSNVWSAISSSADGTRLVAAADSNTDFDYMGGPIYYSTDSGTTWYPSDAPAYSWTAIAASADGSKLIAVSRDDGHFNAVPVYLSTNSGAHWFAASMNSNNWNGATISSDGSKLFAVGGASVIYTSTNSGSTWAFTTMPAGLCAIASSADGSIHFAASGVAGIYTDAAPTPWIKTSAPDTNFWGSVASSDDGSKLVAAVHGVVNNQDVPGPIYRSTDSGATWQLTSAPIVSWNSVASSAEGTCLTALSAWVYTSTDSGLTWRSNNLPFEAWTAAAYSGSGNRLVVASAGGYSPSVHGLIYTSTNAGSNWTQSVSAPNALWNSIACSADGTKLAATIGSTVGSFGLPGPGMILTSPDFGVTWNLMNNAPQALWAKIASSADGTRLIAAPGEDRYHNGLPIYTSTNSGVTWITNNTPADHWVSVSSSADGTRLVAINTTGVMYVSTNSGAVWSSSGTPYQQWQSVAWSGNGNQLVGVSYGGIYLLESAATSPTNTPPWLTITRVANGVSLFWPITADGWILEHTNLLGGASTAWPQLAPPYQTNAEALSVTITNPSPADNQFFRLHKP